MFLTVSLGHKNSSSLSLLSSSCTLFFHASQSAHFLASLNLLSAFSFCWTSNLLKEELFYFITHSLRAVGEQTMPIGRWDWLIRVHHCKTIIIIHMKLRWDESCFWINNQSNMARELWCHSNKNSSFFLVFIKVSSFHLKEWSAIYKFDNTKHADFEL